MRGLVRSPLWRATVALLVLLPSACGLSAARGEGLLDTIRNDVRGLTLGGSSSSDSSSDSDDDHHRHRRHYDDRYDDDDRFYGYIIFESGKLAFYALTSPFWGPHAALDEVDVYFPRYPYDHVPGYMMGDPCLPYDEDPACAADPLRTDRWPARPRTWAARLRMEYADEFNDTERVSGHLLLTTKSRLGLDTETSYYQEQLPGGRQDELWLGDCNVVFRFAQNEHAQFRTGLGFNWLDDPVQTDFGFNFTYGADLFPRRPWVLSSTIDWGTLGEAELFRFRATAGVIVYGVEVYTGYEYLDIDTTQMNGIMGGVRIWF